MFKWTPKRERAALALAHGYTQVQAADLAGVTPKTITNWNKNVEFMAEVDRLTLMVSIATRSERLRIAMKVIRQKMQDDDNFVLTNRDALDWLKFAQSETDGAKLDLAAIFEAMETRTGDDGAPGENNSSKEGDDS